MSTTEPSPEMPPETPEVPTDHPMIRESLEVLGFAAVCLAAEKLTGSQTMRRVGRATTILGGAYLATSIVDALKPSDTGPGRGIKNIVGGWFTDPSQPKVAQSQ